MPWSSRPAAAAVSTTRAATPCSTWRRAAVARRSRTASPPALRAAGGWVPHRSRRSSVRRTNSKAAPAPARSTSDCPRSEVARVGGSSSSRPEAVHRDRRTLHGRVTWRSSMRASRPVATRSAVGPAAPFHRPSAPVSSRWSRMARARGSSPSSSSGTVSTAGPPGTRSTSRTTMTGRGGDPQTRPSVPSRSSAPRTEVSVAGIASGSVSWTSACSTARSRASSPSRARSTDALTTTRAASWDESCGAGVARSGRASSSADSCSSDQPRSCSARVRGVEEDPSTWLGAGILPILCGTGLGGAPARSVS